MFFDLEFDEKSSMFGYGWPAKDRAIMPLPQFLGGAVMDGTSSPVEDGKKYNSIEYIPNLNFLRPDSIVYFNSHGDWIPARLIAVHPQEIKLEIWGWPAHRSHQKGGLHQIVYECPDPPPYQQDIVKRKLREHIHSSTYFWAPDDLADLIWEYAQPHWYDFVKGDRIDALHKEGHWYEAIIQEVYSDSVRVHYLGWSSKKDEIIPCDSPRFAPWHSHTSHPF